MEVLCGFLSQQTREGMAQTACRFKPQDTGSVPGSLPLSAHSSLRSDWFHFSRTESASRTLFYVLGFTWHVLAQIKNYLRTDTQVHSPKPERSELCIVNLLAEDLPHNSKGCSGVKYLGEQWCLYAETCSKDRGKAKLNLKINCLASASWWGQVKKLKDYPKAKQVDLWILVAPESATFVSLKRKISGNSFMLNIWCFFIQK